MACESRTRLTSRFTLKEPVKGILKSGLLGQVNKCQLLVVVIIVIIVVVVVKTERDYI